MDVAVVRSDDMHGSSSNSTEYPIDSCINLEEAVRRRPQFMFAHPEVLVSNKKSLSYLKSKEMQEHVSAVVIDESHLVVEWETFRPAYGQLRVFLFPKVPIVAMTVTKDMQARIIQSVDILITDNPKIIKASPDRPNIYFACHGRGNRGDKRLAPILDGFANELGKDGLDTPLTIVYGNLNVVSDCFMYLSTKLGDKQYYPPGAESKAANRLFTQYHAQ